MKYALLIYANEAQLLSAEKPAVERVSAAYMAYTEAMQKAGVVLGGERLRPTSSATTVRAPDGKSQVLDGPYAETKEQLAGFYLIDVPDLDAAISWATRCPGAARGAIEVRPIWTM
jgi:hypothetical protein